MSLNATCEEHGWSWDPSDDYGCPVCYGINIERDRNLGILQRWLADDHGDFDSYMEQIRNPKESE